jgi:predicted Zn-dependent peptidase
LQITAFPDQPIGRSILVRARACGRLIGASSRLIWHENYRAPDMVVAAAGAVDHQAVVDEVENRFSKFSGPAAAAPESRSVGGLH